MLTLVPDTTITSQSTQPTPISSPDTERALADEAAARAAGFSLRPPVYVLGTAVNTTGVRNFRQSRRDFEALPFASEACGDLAHRVEGERRLDVLVDAPSLRMEPNGRLTSELGSLPISERALDGIARLVTPGGAGYLGECPPSLRATNVNHWLALATRRDRTGEVKPRQLTLRARQTGGSCEIFSVVGPRYSPLDIDTIATQLHAIVPKDTRAEVMYDGYRAYAARGISAIMPTSGLCRFTCVARRCGRDLGCIITLLRQAPLGSVGTVSGRRLDVMATISFSTEKLMSDRSCSGIHRRLRRDQLDDRPRPRRGRHLGLKSGD